MDTNLQDDLLRLRKRVNDLKSLGYMTPESAGTYEQTILLTWQEADRRRQTLLNQAETLRRQAAAADAQAGAFATMASILFNIVNGFVEAGQKRLREEAERQAEKDAQAAEAARAIEPRVEAVSPAKRGRSKK
jgi:hypothetical protein